MPLIGISRSARLLFLKTIYSNATPISLTLQLKILRQLVELQLCHAPEIKGYIDHAWGVVHNKHKKNQTPLPSLDRSDPKSQENLQLLPIGQDVHRIRYWIADGPCTFIVKSWSTFFIFAYICMEIFIRIPLSLFSSHINWFFSNLTCGLYFCRLTTLVHVYESLENHGHFPYYFVHPGGIHCYN